MTKLTRRACFWGGGDVGDGGGVILSNAVEPNLSKLAFTIGAS